MGNLFGSDSGAKLAKQQAEQQQRRTLAELSRQQAETDQAASGPVGRQTGNRLLTYLTAGLSGEGLDKFGQS
ncbi:hypothetical protein [Shinella zoogloeoides]|uniref:hypothetical protein n=1 Tax=Shinella zoogloeoides TaxID=352475 RepID=UPI0028AA50D6|nr:hypothetical protein [Shinella zoogloeoides]